MPITFTNPGEIDPRLFQIFGVSAKDTSNPVGYFGTGLKYAIAILRRHNCHITIHSGLTEYTFTSQEEIFRGQEHTVVKCNGELMPFTLDLGRNWKLWQAYRELYSNCVLDEGGEVATQLQEPRAGYTTITVRGKAFEAEHHRRHETFLQTTPIHATPELEIHNEPSNVIYYRGIRVGTHTKPAAFTYNILEETQLTEDRTLVSDFNLCWEASKLFANNSNRDILRRALFSTGLEADLDYSCRNPTNEWIEIAAEAMRKAPGKINRSMIKKLSQIKQHDTYELAANQQTAKVEQCRAICERIGVTTSFPVKVVTNLGPDRWGLARDNTVYLSDRVFDYGLKTVAATMLEEYIHLSRGLDDCSRPMQEFLLTKILTMYEELTGDIL